MELLDTMFLESEYAVAEIVWPAIDILAITMPVDVTDREYCSVPIDGGSDTVALNPWPADAAWSMYVAIFCATSCRLEYCSFDIVAALWAAAIPNITRKIISTNEYTIINSSAICDLAVPLLECVEAIALLHFC